MTSRKLRRCINRCSNDSPRTPWAVSFPRVLGRMRGSRVEETRENAAIREAQPRFRLWFPRHTQLAEAPDALRALSPTKPRQAASYTMGCGAP
jgi:hypothetical protein